MRAKRTSQISIFDQFAAHDIGRELAGMSAQLDAHPGLLDFVAADLGSGATTGRCGLTAESALRCALRCAGQTNQSCAPLVPAFPQHTCAKATTQR